MGQMGQVLLDDRDTKVRPQGPYPPGGHSLVEGPSQQHIHFTIT